MLASRGHCVSGAIQDVAGLCRGAHQHWRPVLSQNQPPSLASTSGRCSAPAPGRPTQGRQRGLEVQCMAHPRRVAKVASAIQREIGSMFMSDQVIQAAICPESRLGDNSLSAIASVTHTYVANDLQVVKVYVSIYSDDKGKKRAMDNLKRLEPYVRREIGQRVPMRLTPEIRIEYDDSIEEMELVQKVLGPEEVARFTRELDEEAAAASGRPVTAAAPANRAAPNDDEKGFFDVGEEDDVFDRPQAYPDPFGDLFTGSGDAPVSVRPAAAP